MNLIEPFVGQKIARFTILEVYEKSSKHKIAPRVLVLCSCGNKKIIRYSFLFSARNPTKSCGCIKKSGTYYSWRAMIARCTRPEKENYKYYGGRGISFCERWKSFDNFLADMGERPNDMTLDRKDTDLDYSPDNCQWSTRMTQARNRRCNRMTQELADEIRALDLSQAEIARKYGLEQSMISRIKNNQQWMPYVIPRNRKNKAKEEDLRT